MKFEEIEHDRRGLDTFLLRVKDLLNKFENVETFIELKNIIDEMNELRQSFLTLVTVVQLRYSMNVVDEYYQHEMMYVYKLWSEYEIEVANYYRLLIKTNFKEQIIEQYGKQMTEIASKAVQSLNEDIIEELNVENKLINEYTKLIAKSKIDFLGKEINISQLNGYMSNKDRELRKLAYDKKCELMKENSHKIDELFEQLIQVRNKMAVKRGYPSFVEMGYDRLPRIGYGITEVKRFRDLIVKHIVPLCFKLREHQRERLQLEKLENYDEEIFFNNGNAHPRGDLNWLMKQLISIFSQLSQDIGDVFNELYSGEFMDIDTRLNKANGAFTTYLSQYNKPFIFTNYNGSSSGIKTIIHECGHAYQLYTSNKENKIPEYILPTKEACEVNAIALEYLVWPYMDELFSEDADKYRFGHLEDTILSMPYRACIDEFQEYIYSNPHISVEKRKLKWLELENKYLPFNARGNNDYMSNGNLWQIQSHLFKTPFYYIDYALAQVASLHLWNISNHDQNRALDIYKEICKIGGSMSFYELMELSGLPNVFDENQFEKLIEVIEKWFIENNYSI